MILFLDTISPLPEFSLFEDNKIIISQKIVFRPDDKMSDYIFTIYIELEKKFNLSKNLKYLITCTGPGSYTALRVGISFFSGLSISMKIPLIGISSVDLFKLNLNANELYSTALYICSSQNQKFICIFDKESDKYKINKVQDDKLMFKSDRSKIKNLLTNKDSLIVDANIKCRTINFKEIINQYIDSILLCPQPEIIEPIYISNNKILN